MRKETPLLSRTRLGHLLQFFTKDVWEARLEELPRAHAFGYRCARVAHGMVQGLLFEDKLHLRAAALTYFTVLSLVPLLAFAFALLKGFGVYDTLVQESIRPYVLSLLSNNQPLHSAVEKILGFVGHTGVTSLGFGGLLFLVYAATRLLRNVEEALNDIWGARTGRSPLQQVRDYAAILVVTPLCLVAAGALATLGQALSLLRAAGKTLGVSWLVDQAIALLGPLSVLFLGLVFLYTVLPFAKVRLRSAALGAAVGSVLWYVVLVIHVRFQVGVANFNALYAGFAALPIFFAWQHISWLVVLVGAQVAATDQHHRGLARRARISAVDNPTREAVCLSAVLRITRAFTRGEPTPTVEGLSAELAVDAALLGELLERLERWKILLQTRSGEDVAYALAKAPALIRVKHVLDAMRRPPAAEESRGAAGPDVEPLVECLLERLERSAEESPANQTLEELLQHREAAPRFARDVSESEAGPAPGVASAKSGAAPA